MAQPLFISQLPPQGLVPWSRTVTLRGSTLAAGTSTATIYTVPKRQGLIICSVEQFWLEAGLDPLDPSVLTAMQDHQDTYGRVAFNLISNGAAIFDSKGEVFDPIGMGFVRQTKGETRLNVNLIGAPGTSHASAIYLGATSILQAKWTQIFSPGFVPAAIGCRVFGYTCPERVLNSSLDVKTIR